MIAYNHDDLLDGAFFTVELNVRQYKPHLIFHMKTVFKAIRNLSL